MKARIGIRPIIDGRWGGVREALEEQTMKMAKNAKKLIEEIGIFDMQMELLQR